MMLSHKSSFHHVAVWVKIENCFLVKNYKTSWYVGKRRYIGLVRFVDMVKYDDLAELTPNMKVYRG